MGSERATYEPVARAAALDAGINPDVFISLIDRESHFDPYAQSPDGAYGIAQIKPEYHNVDVHDPRASLYYSAHLIASYLNKFNGRYDLALAAYNSGFNAVSHLNGVPIASNRYVISILSDAAGQSVNTQCEVPVATEVVTAIPVPTPTPTPPAFISPVLLIAILLAKL